MAVAKLLNSVQFQHSNIGNFSDASIFIYNLTVYKIYHSAIAVAIPSHFKPPRHTYIRKNSSHTFMLPEL